MTEDGIQAETVRLGEASDGLDVNLLRPPTPLRTVLFMAGRGGSPARHRPLLNALSRGGSLVVAPHFEPLASTAPGQDELLSRLDAARRALAFLGNGHPPLVGVGHSIGAMLLLVLAGARARTLKGDDVDSAAPVKFARLALMAPPTDFFRAEGALDAITTPVQLWAGTGDAITPPAQADFLRAAIAKRADVDFRLVEGAGHFSFMDELPPHIRDPFPDRHRFLADLADAAKRFVTE